MESNPSTSKVVSLLDKNFEEELLQLSDECDVMCKMDVMRTPILKVCPDFVSTMFSPTPLPPLL